MEEYVGELYAIYILQDYQGRGVGTALMRGAFEHLLANGMGTMYVWVLSANPSRLFYEALGGTPIGTKTVDIGGRLLEETAYGWSDIAPLAMQ
jgi:GNAT superfamily N-acetyltransferase